MEKGLSQIELGKAAGVTFQQIQKYETGRNRISASRLYRFANALDVEVAAFYEGIDTVHVS
ncbi:MAG: helix-turn-helix transcriptional regulator [Hyphomicrobiales bacterium]|nr:helix-turn-helix transcriptional regulator [Hyphomicrobiales bacterium]MCP5372042.1 helix-turn-helix transcriptional regulator [Hyphomicrobiales bacterium]